MRAQLLNDEVDNGTPVRALQRDRFTRLGTPTTLTTVKLSLT
jgi:hypothetical protein